MAFLESMLGFISMKFIEDFMKQYKPKQIENLDKNVIDLDIYILNIQKTNVLNI